MAAHALDLQTLLTQTLALPAQPRIVALLLRELVPEQPSLRRLSQLFAADPALSAGLLAQPGFDPLACVLHIAAWRARSREAQWGERALAVSFPGEVGVALGLDIDMVLRQDPVDWMADTGLDVLL